MTKPVSRYAPAKVNLTLNIVGRRDDGYHRLESLVGFTQRLGDLVTVEGSDDLRFSLSGPYSDALKADKDWGLNNLASKAAILLKTAAQVKAGAHIKLVKRIPVAAGLGGGSADAAATLFALNAFWQTKLELKVLLDLAARLGADVPMCLYPVPYFVREIGNHLSPIGGATQHPILLVNPDKSCSTPAVFAHFRDSGAPFAPELGAPPVDRAEAIRTGQNMLTDSAAALVPEITGILAALEAQTGAVSVRMAGSGATCFALFEDDAARDAASDALKSQYPDYWLHADTVMI